MVPQCVSCIATRKLFVDIGKKKLFFVFFLKPPTVTPLALCSIQKNIFEKNVFFLNRKIISFAGRQKILHYSGKILRR